MRKEDKLLPPPSVDERDELQAVSRFMAFIIVGAVIGIFATSVVYGTALYSVIRVLESVDAVAWKLSWPQSFFIIVIFQFVRAWDRNIRPSKNSKDS